MADNREIFYLGFRHTSA